MRHPRTAAPSFDHLNAHIDMLPLTCARMCMIDVFSNPSSRSSSSIHVAPLGPPSIYPYLCCGSYDLA
ncbi:hypothetical protein BDN70DRAFT_674852 [Pholiota conissans]|uniref:Uncharacterized protein n=1 Tax=Pholiota conissans TaxID=109636 RepID=A0A9P5Z588_9AGAR|nr:hypothetical protein BDN70DRAFT_674852 [Pholiota conissans]